MRTVDRERHVVSRTGLEIYLDIQIPSVAEIARLPALQARRRVGLCTVPRAGRPSGLGFSDQRARVLSQKIVMRGSRPEIADL